MLRARRDRCPACAVKAGISNPKVQGGRDPKGIGFVNKVMITPALHSRNQYAKGIGSENIWPSHEHRRDKLARNTTCGSAARI